MSGRSPCAGSSPPALFPHSAPGARPGETPVPSPVAVLAAWVHRPGLAVALLPPGSAGSGAAGRSVFRPGPACPRPGGGLPLRGCSPCGDAPVSLSEPRTGFFPPSGRIGTFRGGLRGLQACTGGSQECVSPGGPSPADGSPVPPGISRLCSQSRVQAFSRPPGGLGRPGGLRGRWACTGAREKCVSPGGSPAGGGSPVRSGRPPGMGAVSPPAARTGGRSRPGGGPGASGPCGGWRPRPAPPSPRRFRAVFFGPIYKREKF